MPRSDPSPFTVFCDETGNSGSRFFSPEQPIYAEGGWFVRNDQRAGLEATIKEALRVQVQQAGERELAMDLKLVKSQSVDVGQLAWTRRSIIARERIRQDDALARMTATQTNHQHIHL